MILSFMQTVLQALRSDVVLSWGQDDGDYSLEDDSDDECWELEEQTEYFTMHPGT